MSIRTLALALARHAAFAAGAMVFIAGNAGAQTAVDSAQLGIRYLPEATAVFDLPFDGHWGVRSSVSGLSMISGQGLKFGVAGTYGWDFGNRSRVAFAAGVARIDQPSLLPGMTVGVNRLQFGGGAHGVDARDVTFNLSLDWRYSRALTVSTGLDISYSLADPLPLDWQSVTRPTSSIGYIGLKYRF